jgi:hypothetical protein
MNPAAPLRPRRGDIVVARDSKSPKSFTVRQVPGAVQFCQSSRDEALQLVRSFARKHAIDLWYDEGGAYRLLEAYRPRRISWSA